MRCLICYIEKISKVETYENRSANKNFDVIKFFVNNNDGSVIQCNIYNALISKFSSALVLNEIVYLENMSVIDKKHYSKGNVHFELLIQGYLRSNFSKKAENVEYEFFSSITDGTYKLDILLESKESDTVIYEPGMKLEIKGDLNTTETGYILNISTNDNIKILDDAKMEFEDLISGNQSFSK
ncbi:hypothetical protein TKK_0003035 [Trichogramma kaykai]